MRSTTTLTVVIVGVFGVGALILIGMANLTPEIKKDLSTLVSGLGIGLIGFLGHQIGKSESKTAKGDVINVSPTIEDKTE